jgi:hypothetical protein
MNDERIKKSRSGRAVGGGLLSVGMIPWTLAEDSCHARQREVMCFAAATALFSFQKETIHHSTGLQGSVCERPGFVFRSWESNLCASYWSLFLKAVC